jgi:hypothetical protein
LQLAAEINNNNNNNNNTNNDDNEVRENIKISAEESLGYLESKKHKP